MINVRRLGLAGCATAVTAALLAACGGGGGSGETTCPSGQVRCDGRCVDSLTDEQHCGASGDCLGANSGRACEAGETCDGSGVCVLSCPAGQVACDRECIDPRFDRRFCGASGDCEGANAGEACPTGEVCDGSGTCAPSCQAGSVLCGGACLDPLTSRDHCGASGDCLGANAGVACQEGEICDGTGTCSVSCQAGLVECDGVCVNPLTDNHHCGASGDCQATSAGSICGPGQVCDGTGHCALSCQPGSLVCSGACVNPLTSRSFCGTSGDCLGENAGTTCGPGEICDGTGQFALTCQVGLTPCSGTCTNLLSDQFHCGACDNPCPAGQVCDGVGHCALSCQMGLTNCSGTCTNLQSDQLHCGTCNHVCAAGEACDGTGHCVLVCPPGLTQCTDACVDTQNDPDHCGECNHPCPGIGFCSGGTCQPVCGDSIVDPGEECDDGNRTPGDGCDGFCRIEICVRYVDRKCDNQ